jgi:ABC-type uncharacterized transport system substrate-binding protein
MRRREFITLLGGAATFIPPSAWAQQSQLPLIGVLNAASAKSTASSYEAFRSALRQLGYIEGRNFRIVPQLREMQAAAAKASLALVHFDYRVPEDLERAFTEFVQAKADALLVPPDTTFSSNVGRIVELAAKARLPATYGDRRAVESGGLLSYGPNVVENYRRSAVYVDQILKGAKPADLPVEQPTKIELVINIKTAKALGLEIPPTLLARADEVVE